MEPGTRLEQYEIIEKIGEGGMGAVYRAEDTRLKRPVAVKVLPPEFALDEERLARLEREAQLLASLNHPNVATVHGFGDVTIEEDGADRRVAFVVMELVEGRSLYDRVAEGPLPWREAVDIGIGIAAGLEAAHERGIVHRDLKPANVHLTPDGTVKVLDFGLAKAFEADGAGSGSLELSASPTVAAATRTGLIMGTAAYMSPEQARGKAVDKRADIWALGCVLFEMLGGRKPFDGETISDVLAAILRATPDADALPPIPDRLRQILDRCLEKDPARRMRDVADVRLELEAAKQDRVRGGAASTVGGWSWKMIAPVAAAAIVLGAAAGWLLRGGPALAPELRVILAAESVGEGPNPIAVSADGLLVAETSIGGGIRIQAADEIAWRALQDTEGALALTFDAEGRRIYFSRSSEILSIGIDGSAPIVEASLDDVMFIPGIFRGLDGAVYAGAVGEGNSLRIVRIEPGGGYEELWSSSAGDFTILTAQLREGLWLGWGFAGGAVTGLVAIDAGAEAPISVIDGYRSARHLGGGRVLAVDERGRLALMTLDAMTAAVIEPPVVRVEGLAFFGGSAAGYDVSANNILVYAAGERAGGAGGALAWLDRSGRTEVISERRGGHNTDTRVSPDGSQLALELDVDDEAFTVSVWIHDVARDVRTALTPGVGSAFPLWSPDGRDLIIEADEGVEAPGMYRVPTDRSAPLQLVLAADEGRFVLPQDWSPDGESVIYVDSATLTRIPAPDNDIRIVPASGGEPVDFLATTASEIDPRFSPDGRWVAYASNQSGDYQVYIRPLEAGGEMRISADGGRRPDWGPGGDELYFQRGDQLFVVDIDLADRPVVSAERLLVAMPENARPQLAAPAHDGDRFLVSLFGSGASRPALHAIYNWQPESPRSRR